jgi:hypothetical protein
MEMHSYDALSYMQAGTMIATVETRPNRSYKGSMTKLAMIDTAEAVEDLKCVGASQKLGSVVGSLATKDDLKNMAATLRGEIVNAKTLVQRRIIASRNWMIGSQIAIAGVVIAALRFS